MTYCSMGSLQAEEWSNALPLQDTLADATLSVPESPHSNDEKFFQRLEMHGAPWCIDLPKEALGGLWVAKPSEMMSPEGFPSEVAALRAAYVIGNFMNENTAHALLRALVDGASHTHTAGNPGNVLAYNASYALQSLCSRPKFALESGIVRSLRGVLEAGPESLDGLTQPINTAGTVVSQNYSAWILADIVSALIASKCSSTTAAQEEIQAVVVAFGEVLVLEDPVPLPIQCIQWACAESLGIINAALKVKSDAENGIWSNILDISRSYLFAGIDAANATPTMLTTPPQTPAVAASASASSSFSSSAARRLAKMVTAVQQELTGDAAAQEERGLLALRAATRNGVAGSKGERPQNQMIFALYKMGEQAGPPLPEKKAGISFKTTYVVGQRANKFMYMSN